MIKFITLDYYISHYNKQLRKININISCIESIRDNDGVICEYANALIKLVSGSLYCVYQTPEEIFEMIKRLENENL